MRMFSLTMHLSDAICVKFGALMTDADCRVVPSGRSPIKLWCSVATRPLKHANINACRFLTFSLARVFALTETFLGTGYLRHVSKMQRHKIVAWIILLILSVINFVLGTPVLERGIREVRVDAVDVAEDVATASQKRCSPSNKWWTNSALADRTNAPLNLESSDSDYRLEQNLRPHDPRSPMDSNASPQLSLPVESTDLDNSHSLPVDPPPSAHNDLPLGIDSNAPPEPSPEPTEFSGSRSHSMDSPTDSDSSGYYLTYSTDSATYSPYHPTTPTGLMSPWSSNEASAILKSPSSSPSHDPNPPPQHGNLDAPNEFYHRPHPVLDDHLHQHCRIRDRYGHTLRQIQDCLSQIRGREKGHTLRRIHW
ncbi:hypothetical protein BGY98DRAFT_383452 [Russula aff. rugulosa BPL654]|nr:hypothetical protein BGY98DRAFT_383452 [Russula aff. rugulosa BPL654]